MNTSMTISHTTTTTMNVHGRTINIAPKHFIRVNDGKSRNAGHVYAGHYHFETNRQTRLYSAEIMAYLMAHNLITAKL